MQVKQKNGFTLIELLVVIAIIGILASVVLASLNSARRKSRDARRLSDIRQIQNALELYFNGNGSYPGVLSDLANSTCSGAPCIAKVPSPPSGASQTSYAYTARGAVATSCTTYHLGASMELAGTGIAHLAGDIDAAPDTIGVACTVGGSSPADFHGNALDCSGTTPATIDNCYDIKP